MQAAGTPGTGACPARRRGKAESPAPARSDVSGEAHHPGHQGYGYAEKAGTVQEGRLDGLIASDPETGATMTTSVAHVHSIEHTIHTTNRWLNHLSEAIGTSDREFVHGLLRTWLHAVRDALTVQASAHFAAQLPDLIRGIYYNGWNASAVPIRRDRQEFIDHFATSGRIAHPDVPKLAPLVTEFLCRELSEPVVKQALAQLPQDVRALLRPKAMAGTG